MFNIQLTLCILSIFLGLFSCIKRTELTYGNYCIDELKEGNELKHVLLNSKHTFSGQIGLLLFTKAGNGYEKVNRFNDDSFLLVKKFVSDAFNDVSEIIFQEALAASSLTISEVISPSSNCRDSLLKVSPFFLQTIYERALEGAIEVNTVMFNGNNYIKNPTHFFDLLFISRKDLNERFASNASQNREIAYEFKRIELFIHYELMKSLSYIFGHEAYHFLSKCKFGQKYEYEADGLGVLIYQFLNYEIHYGAAAMSECYYSPSQREVISNLDSSQIVDAVIGRSLVSIVRDIYRYSDFEEESVTHPPLNNRLDTLYVRLNDLHPDSLYWHYINDNILKNPNQ